MLEGENWHVIEPREISVLDRIGGGDGFVGGLLYGILKEWEPEKCMQFGWASGALAPRPQDAKLLAWTIVLPTVDAVTELRAHLQSRGVAITDEPSGILVVDPWGTPVRVRVEVPA